MLNPARGRASTAAIIVITPAATAAAANDHPVFRVKERR
jgi:hypothetical protein